MTKRRSRRTASPAEVLAARMKDTAAIGQALGAAIGKHLSDQIGGHLLRALDSPAVIEEAIADAFGETIEEAMRRVKLTMGPTPLRVREMPMLKPETVLALIGALTGLVDELDAEDQLGDRMNDLTDAVGRGADASIMGHVQVINEWLAERQPGGQLCQSVAQLLEGQDGPTFKVALHSGGRVEDPPSPVLVGEQGSPDVRSYARYPVWSGQGVYAGTTGEAKPTATRPLIFPEQPVYESWSELERRGAVKRPDRPVDMGALSAALKKHIEATSGMAIRHTGEGPLIVQVPGHDLGQQGFRRRLADSPLPVEPEVEPHSNRDPVAEFLAAMEQVDPLAAMDAEAVAVARSFVGELIDEATFMQEYRPEFGGPAELAGDGSGMALPPIDPSAKAFAQSGSFKTPSDTPPKALHPADESMTVPYGATMQRSGASLFLLCPNSMDEFWAKASAARDRGRPLAFSRPSGELIGFGRVVDVRGLTGRDEYQVEIELGDVK